jgi:hypothetical protein
MNEELKNLHDSLISQHEALYEKLDVTPDDETMQAILTEMREIRHRIDIVQGLLFRETSASLKASMAKISDADNDLTDALKSAGTATAVVKGVSKFLTVVDKAIDLAKTLGPLVV